MEQVRKIDSKLNSIELLRILGVVLILVFHAFYIIDRAHTIYPYCRMCWVFVECFFIIAGFFLPNILIKRTNFKDFAVTRIIRLFPVVFFVTVFANIFHFHKHFYEILPDFFLLSNIGLKSSQVALLGACWFLFVLFWCSCFYCCLLNIIKDKLKFNFTVALIIYFALVMFTNGGGSQNDNAYYIFNNGILRGFISIGIGILVRLNFYNPESIKSLKNKIFFTILELFLFFYLIINLTCIKYIEAPRSMVLYIFLFALLIICFVNNAGYFSKVLNKVNLYPISKYSFSIYVMQNIPWVFLHSSQQISGYTYVTLFVISSVILGIIAYHVIEVPCRKLYKNSIRGGGKILAMSGFYWNRMRLNYETC